MVQFEGVARWVDYYRYRHWLFHEDHSLSELAKICIS